MTSSESPNPRCPSCSSVETFEIVHDQADPTEQGSAEGWVHFDGICDVHPDKWICGKCEFRWYPRDIVERDLDLLTWQLDQEKRESAKEAIRARLATLRKVITILANAESQIS